MKTLFAIVVLAATVFSQDFISAEKPFSKDRLTGVPGLAMGSGGLLDPNRFSMHQSYSMSYWSSGSQSDMTGLYLNSLQYDFSIPLTLQVDIGVFHRPLALINGKDAPPGTENQTLTVPRVGLTYQPSKNIFMTFEYINIPAGYSTSPFSPGMFTPLPGPRRAAPLSGQ